MLRNVLFYPHLNLTFSWYRAKHPFLCTHRKGKKIRDNSNNNNEITHHQLSYFLFLSQQNTLPVITTFFASMPATMDVSPTPEASSRMLAFLKISGWWRIKSARNSAPRQTCSPTKSKVVALWCSVGWWNSCNTEISNWIWSQKILSDCY